MTKKFELVAIEFAGSGKTLPTAKLLNLLSAKLMLKLLSFHVLLTLEPKSYITPKLTRVLAKQTL